MEIDIIYEDKDIILCRKPHGLATQTSRLGQQDMVSLLKNYRAKKKEDSFIGPVHRLDQPVEGIMVFAKTKKVAAHLSRQVANRTIGKHYYALVWADERLLDEGEIEDYLLTDKKQNVTSVVPQETEGAKRAGLHYRVLERRKDMALLDICLHTGRQHQIRVQFSSRGWPLVGDRKYGKENDSGERLALCSYGLEFIHPSTGEEVNKKLKWEEFPWIQGTFH